MTETPFRCLITGASSGFGLRLCLDLASRNWQVYGGIRTAEGGRALESAARAASVASRIHATPLDVSRTDTLRRAISEVLAQCDGKLDLLVNNAGYTSMAFFENLSDAECRAIMETNFFGAIGVTRAVLPAMRDAGSGRIAFITSNAVNTPHPTMAMYAASKWALEGFAEALAMEVAPFGIDVTVIEPGNFRTPFGSKVRAIEPKSSQYVKLWKQLIPGLAKLGNMGADPGMAAQRILEAVTMQNPKFKTRIGVDTEFFARWKHSYERRAAAVRRIAGFPRHPN